MAEENQEKNFYPFTVKIDEERRQQKINSLSRKIPLAKVLELLDIDDSEDKYVIEQKLWLAMQRELNAMDYARAPEGVSEADSRDKRYQDSQGQIDFVRDFFAAEEDFLKNNYDIQYNDYLDKVDLVQNKATSEEQKQTELQALKEEYSACLEARKGMEERDKSVKGLIDTLDILERTPKEVNQELIAFYKKFKENNQEEAFNRLYNEFLYDYQQEIRPSKNDDGKLVNQPHFKIDSEGRACRSVLNLQDTGLDITLINNNLAFAHCYKELTKEQIKALAQYCWLNGIDIEDALKLKELKVVDEKGEDIGNAADELQKEISSLSDQSQATPPSNVNTGSIDISQAPEASITPTREENIIEGDFRQFIPPVKHIEPNMAKMVDATKACIGKMGFPPESGLVDVRRSWNSTIISVYASENDRLDDGEVDKNGHRKHTKQFAVELVSSRPPTARLYMEAGKEFKADHARLSLDAFKAVGCKYFIFPSLIDTGGKKVQGAFISASIKTKMIPYLKGSKNGIGCDIGAPDIENLLKELPDEKMTDLERTEFLMRWSQQVDKYMSWNSKAAKDLADGAGKLKQQARFQMFSSSYLEKLEDYISDGMNGKLEGKRWDSVDQITANLAMNKIINDISHGRLNGKVYNPLGDNEELIKKTFTQYMANERPGIEIEIQDNMIRLSKSKETENAKTKSAVNNALNRCKGELDKTLGRLKGVGIDMHPKIVGAKEDYYVESSNTRQENTQQNNQQNDQPSGSIVTAKSTRLSNGKQSDDDEKRRRDNAYRKQYGVNRANSRS